MRRTAPVLAAALAAALIATGCGGSGSATVTAPKGPPAARHHGKAVNYLETVELARAHLVAATDAAYILHPANARLQVKGAAQEYAKISPLVRTPEPVLDRELRAAFVTADELIVKNAPFASIQLRLGLVQGQLLDAAYAAITGIGARADLGVQAAALDRISARLAKTYAASAREGNTDQGRQDFETAWGLQSRSQALWHAIGDALGPENNTIRIALSTIKVQAFPFGVGRPRSVSPKPVAVAAEVAKVHAALVKRFEL